MQIDFSLLDDPAPIDQFSGSIALILQECQYVCSTLLHHGIRKVHENVAPSLVYLAGLRPMIEHVLAQESASPHKSPKVQVVKNTIITHSTLCSGSKQLICLEKKSWNGLYQALCELNLSVFQLSWPLHQDFFSCTPRREPPWLDFDCFFLSIDEDTVKAVESNEEFLKLFQRVIIFESDPACITRMSGMLDVIRQVNISTCFINPDISGLSFRLYVPEQQIMDLSGQMPGDHCNHIDLFNANGSDASFEPLNHNEPDVYQFEAPRVQQTSLEEASAVRNTALPTWMGPMPSFPQEPFISPPLGQESYKENMDTRVFFRDQYDGSNANHQFETQLDAHYPDVFNTHLHTFPEMDTFESQHRMRFDNRNALEDIRSPEIYAPMEMDYCSPVGIGVQPAFRPVTTPRHIYSPPPMYCDPRAMMYGRVSPHHVPFTPQRNVSPMLAQVPGFLDSSPSPFADMSHDIRGSPSLMGSSHWSQPMNPIQSFRHIEKMYDEMRAKRPAKRRLRQGEKFKKFT